MEFIIAYKEVLMPLLTGVVAYFSGLKTKKLNFRTKELENLEKVREVEKTLLIDMEGQVKKLIDYTDHLEKINSVLRKELERYKRKYGDLDKEDESKVS